MTTLQFNKIAFAAAFLCSFANMAHASESQYNLRIDGITCPTCIIKAGEALKQLGGVGKVEFNLNEGIVRTCVKEGVVLDENQVNELFLSKGFAYRGMEKQEQCNL